MKNRAKNESHFMGTTTNALKNLINSNSKTINVIVKNDKNFAGVYAISYGNDCDILSVGQTDNIGNRMKEHLRGESQLRKKIKKFEKDLKWYKVRYRRHGR